MSYGKTIGVTYAAGNVGRYRRVLDLEQLRDRVGRVVRTRVFLSYSHRDRPWKDRVKVHLQPVIGVCVIPTASSWMVLVAVPSLNVAKWVQHSMNDVNED